MASQKEAVLKLVDEYRERGRSVGHVLGSIRVARSISYRWKKYRRKKKDSDRVRLS